MRKIMLITLLISFCAVSAEAAPRVTLSVPGTGGIQQGFWSGVVGDTLEILPPPGWSTAGSSMVVLYRNDAIATVGAAGVSRGAIASVSRFLPYVGVGIMAYMAYNDIRDAVSGSPGQYPNIEAATKISAAQLPTSTEPTPSTGSVIYDPIQGLYGTIGTLYDSWDGAMDVPPSYLNFSGEVAWGILNSDPKLYYVAWKAGSGEWFHWRKYNLTSYGPTSTGDRAATDAELAENLNGTATGYNAALDPKYRSELDAMMKAQENRAVDASNYNIMQTAAQGAMTQYQADKSGQSHQATADAITNAQNAYNDALARYNDLKSRADAAQAASSANPNDLGLMTLANSAADAAAQARAAVEAAKSVLDQLLADQARRDADEAIAPPSVADNVYDSTIEPPEKKDIPSLLERIYTDSPIASLLHSFTFDVQSASCSETLFEAYGQTYDFDMCPYESQMTMAGTIIQAFAFVSALFIIFRHHGEAT